MVASRACSASPNEVRLAFPLDSTHQPVGALLRADSTGVKATVFGTTERAVVERQLARILSLDHDGQAYAEVLEAHEPLRKAAAQAPGFRPPVFYSPYAAAGWLVLGQRVRRAQATKWLEALAHAASDVVDVGGVAVASFPKPQTFLERPGFAGIPEEKWRRLQAVARAALDGQLNVERLRAKPYAEAWAALQRIRGVGAWTADGILFRGAGLRDAFITSEPQLHHAVQLAYGLDHVPDDDELEQVGSTWRPYRTWVSVLLTMQYYRATDGVAPTVRRRGGDHGHLWREGLRRT